MALRVLPFGGVYVAGGIALKILPKMKDGAFVRIFSAKSKLSRELACIPIYVVLNEGAPVLGVVHEDLAAEGPWHLDRVMMTDERRDGDATKNLSGARPWLRGIRDFWNWSLVS